MSFSPRVLLSIDYEPWFALSARSDAIGDAIQRKALDQGFVDEALPRILEQLGDKKASFYIVGEIADWYPRIPEQILEAGHELGLHCQRHRSLIDVVELAADIKAAEPLIRRFGMRGYRAPMVGIDEGGYELLAREGFLYSSSVYAPAGTLLSKRGIWELPVSTLRVIGRRNHYTAPVDFSRSLLASGEIPYGSSFSIGLCSGLVLRILESELRADRNPVIILHPYELVQPVGWPSQISKDLLRNPFLWPFAWSKSGFLSELVRSLPVSPLIDYVEAMQSRAVSGSEV
ncbi:MAG TPA: hypothetical protein VIU38_04085 [Anaerolineales bacterium]